MWVVGTLELNDLREGADSMMHEVAYLDDGEHTRLLFLRDEIHLEAAAISFSNLSQLS